MVGKAKHLESLAEPPRAVGHPVYGHTFAGHDAAGADDSSDAVETGPFMCRLAAGIGVWGLILLLML